jgi:Family of unknown function (DUF6627)
MNMDRVRNVSFICLAIYLVLAMIVLSFPSQGWAMFIPSAETVSIRKADLNSIQKTLETAVIKQRLADFGLSSEEAFARINNMSDQQVHQLAANLDSIQAGGDGLGALVFLLLVAIIVVVVLAVTGHRVIVR